MNRTFFRTAVLGLALVASATTAYALDRRVRIHNDTGYVMREFYASNVDTKSWEEDILGRDVLPSGSSVMVTVDDGTGYCKYDFLAVFEDGDQVQSDGSVNVCEVADYYFK